MFDLLYSIFFMVYLIKETHYKGSRKKSNFLKAWPLRGREVRKIKFEAIKKSLATKLDGGGIKILFLRLP